MLRPTERTADEYRRRELGRYDLLLSWQDLTGVSRGMEQWEMLGRFGLLDMLSVFVFSSQFFYFEKYAFIP